MPLNVYPRINSTILDRIYGEIEGVTDIGALAKRASFYHELAIYTQTGGDPVERLYLQGLRKQIVEIASSCGYPDEGTAKSRAEFDRLCTKWMAGNLIICHGEAFRESFWAFFAAVLLPDVCRWRFSSLNRKRLEGGIRNVFGRLWHRMRLLDRGRDRDDRWELVEKLTEDAFVQITERKRLMADPCLARETAEAWVRTSEKIGRASMEAVCREAMKYIFARSPVICLEALPAAELAELLDFYFEQGQKAVVAMQEAAQ